MSEPVKPEESADVSNAFLEAAASAAAQHTPEPSPTPSPGEPEPSSALTAAFRAAQVAGLDVGQFKSDEELVQHLAKQISDARPYVDYANQVLPYDRDLRDMIAKRSQPAPEPAAPQAEAWSAEKHFGKAWGKPEYDTAWDAFIQSGMITVDQETGQFVADPRYAQSVPLQVLQGLNGRRQWQRQALERLLENPFQETWNAIQEPLERYIQERIDGTFKQFTANQAVNAWEAENAKVLYEHDATGQPQYDVYGNPQVTPYGDAFIRAATYARQSFPGIQQGDIIRYASAVAAPYLTPASPAAPTPEPTPPEQEKSFMQKAMQRASHSPNSGGYSEASDIEPVVLEHRELENMFSAAAKKAGL
jgi:hypothetical protein